MTIEQISNNWLNDKKKALIDNYIRLKASGEYEKSLEPFYENKGGDIKLGMLGARHSEFMENGRRPNADQSESAIKKWVGWAGSTFLKKWVKDKQININPFAVAYKIAREGVKVPNKNNAGGVVSDVINEAAIKEYQLLISQFFVTEFKSEISNLFEK